MNRYEGEREVQDGQGCNKVLKLDAYRQAE